MQFFQSHTVVNFLAGYAILRSIIANRPAVNANYQIVTSPQDHPVQGVHSTYEYRIFWLVKPQWILNLQIHLNIY